MTEPKANDSSLSKESNDFVKYSGSDKNPKYRLMEELFDSSIGSQEKIKLFPKMGCSIRSSIIEIISSFVSWTFL